MTVKIIPGDCRKLLPFMQAESVHCVVTSPPYWGLRDYGGGRDQLGLEQTPDEYVEAMVAVFEEVRRVLRPDGTFWLNLGDCYATNGGAGYQGKNGTRADRRFTQEALRHRLNRETRNRGGGDIKAKDLVGVPWMLAFALRAQGWWLRQDIVWSKPNPMPESVRDRCTKSHEYLFLLTKDARYYYDADAIAEPVSPVSVARVNQPGFDAQTGGPKDYRNTGVNENRSARQALENFKRSGNKARKPSELRGVPAGTGKNQAGSIPWQGWKRNKRDVWTVTTVPYKDAHFATFPEALIEPCILAGCPSGGVVLDPFFGAGTTGVVADRLGRDCIGIELNPEYIAMAERRMRGRTAGLELGNMEALDNARPHA